LRTLVLYQLKLYLSIHFYNENGNGKRHRTPYPAGLRKIKRISLNTFLRLKELFNSVKVYNSITPRGNRKKSNLRRRNLSVTVQQHYVYEYEPSNIINAYGSSIWRWRRVYEWYNYINDPIENIKGRIIT
jgi:hypothetical protein